MLYAAAALLVAGGATWWFLSAPPDRGNDEVEAWRAAVERELPDSDTQADASTMTLQAGVDQSFETSVETGEYQVSLICRGGPESFVRVSLSQTGRDSGLGLRCSEDRAPDSFKVGLGDAMRLHVVVGDVGPVVFRYSLQRVVS